MGDFNVVRCTEERLGSCFNLTKVTDFNNFIDFSQLIEPPLRAKRFTWIGRGGSKLSKLGRFLLLKEFYNVWPSLSAIVLDRCFSDHSPILLKLDFIDYGPSHFFFFLCLVENR